MSSINDILTPAAITEHVAKLRQYDADKVKAWLEPTKIRPVITQNRDAAQAAARAQLEREMVEEVERQINRGG